MKTKNISKIGLIFIILIFSLASISISYAGWTDTIQINGSISTWTGEGCSHGHWKNHHDDWVDYDPDQTLDTVFTFPDELDELNDDTLDDALRYNGGDDLIGGAQILLRNAVASVLNAAHPNVNYPISETEVRDQVNTSLASLDRDNMLNLESTYDYYNNLGGCLCD